MVQVTFGYGVVLQHGQNGMDQTFMTATQMSFSHYDWWRSTDNGGTGVHTTPDGEVPKIIQLEGGLFLWYGTYEFW